MVCAALLALLLAPLAPGQGSEPATHADDPVDALKEEFGIDPSLLGRLFSNSIKIDGFDVPLPGAHWAIASHGTLKGHNISGDGYFLIKVYHGELAKGLLVRLLRAKAGETMDQIRLPKIRTLLASSPECSAPGTESCWEMYPFSTYFWQRWGDTSTPLDIVARRAAEFMDKRGIKYPHRFIATSFVRHASWGVMEATYYSNSDGNDLTPVTPGADPKAIVKMTFNAKYITDLKTWANAFWPRIQAAFAAGKQ
jgi:hypothetical protein